MEAMLHIFERLYLLGAGWILFCFFFYLLQQLFIWVDILALQEHVQHAEEYMLGGFVNV